MVTGNKSIIRRLDDSLVLRYVQSEADIARFAGFNRAINGADQGATCEALLRGHPRVRRENFWMVEDEQRGEVVSTTCLIPWRCRMGTVTLAVAMLEMVVTHPAYRKRGLVRAQIDHFHQTVAEQGFDLAIIEGIPYYYRQFGYGYALDHWAVDALPITRVPAMPELGMMQYRAATPDDIPWLQEFYAHTNAAYTLHVQRDAADWCYLLQAAHYPIYLLHDAQSDAPLGYVSAWRQGDAGQTVVLMESGIPLAESALALLRSLTSTCREVWIGYAAHSTLTQVGQNLGAQPRESDQWLLRVPDLPGLLRKLAPLFAERLAASAWAGFSGSLLLNLYRQAYRLVFAAGRLEAVEAVGFVDASMGADAGDLAIPPDAFLRLLVGYRSLDALHDAWPDIVVRPQRRGLLATLFPVTPTHVWMPYLHCGHLSPLLDPLLQAGMP